MKRFICWLLFLVLPVSAFADNDSELKKTAEYVCKTVQNPTVSSIGGEWGVIALASSGENVPDGYFNRYRDNALEYVTEKGGVLHERKYTEYSRVVLALNAIGENPRSFGGFDLTLPLLDTEKTAWQGINGSVWALIALNSGDYAPENICRVYKNNILSAQNDDGGWSFGGGASDVDLTAMALCALSEYPEEETAIKWGIDFLSNAQTQSGGFVSGDVENCESTAQVIIALCSLNIPLDDERFVKGGNTLVDNLLSYSNENGSFNHTDQENLMATEQAFCALSAMKREKNGMSGIYSPSDEEKNSLLTADKKNDEAKDEIHFSDVDDGAKEIISLAKKGIINGMGDDTFAPDNTMTRAEFAAITVRSVGLEEKSVNKFDDVTQGDWFYGAVSAAFESGIVNGVSDNLFNPGGTITRQEAMCMVMRAARLLGVGGEYDKDAVRDVLSVYEDYTQISSWAAESAAFCIDLGICPEREFINPEENVTRSEIAVMIYNMMHKAHLI